MSYPKQTYAMFELTIPSSGKKAKYRPFTVREEKQLALARESKDDATIANAVMETLKQCMGEGFDAKALAFFDIEYLFVQVRAKSAGEVISLRLQCDNDPTHDRTPHNVDITKAQVVFPANHEKKILLFDDVGIGLKYPSVENLYKFEKADDYQSILMCMDYVYDNDGVYYANEHTDKENMDFLESLTEAQLESIKTKFLNTFPKYELTLEWECMICKHKHKKIVKGLAGFFH